ncbi:MAG: histidine--tRNA ligase [Candidatus Aenigmarchaeota archaeon]|nr:histidine--tRNA ligase [Candidatus Aenigmarchaeota archaeon]
MTFQPPKGTRDFLPEEMAKRRKAFDTCRAVFEKYGFGEVDTPVFESLEMLTAKGSLGEEAVKDIYRFEDKSKRKLGLRYDLTVPIVRLFLSQKFSKPVKWYYINKVWRYEDISKGRWREFSQCDAEIIGSPSAEADSEILGVAIDCLLSLGVKDIDVRINSRKIMDSMAEKAGIKEKDALFRAIDKLEKKGESEVRKELSSFANAKQIDIVMKAVRSSSGEPELDGIIALLPQAYRKFVKQDFSIARGLDYYTGFIFEIRIKGAESLGSVLGGGRYDRLIEKYGGEPTPATGFGLGIDRVIAGMSNTALSEPKGLFIISLSEPAKEKARELAQELRVAGIVAETDLMGRPLSKQLDYANKKGVKYTLVIGDKELSSGRAMLRDMKSGKEIQVGLKAKEIAKTLSA